MDLFIAKLNGIVSAGSLSQLLFYCFCRLLLCHAGNIHASDINIFTDCLCIICQSRTFRCQNKSCAGCQDQAYFLSFFHSVTPLADLLQVA